MQSESFEYPQYRKYVGIETYYKIESPEVFVELIKLGANIQEHRVEAIQYPEKLRIQDMLSCLDGRWEVISEDDFLAFRDQ